MRSGALAFWHQGTPAVAVQPPRCDGSCLSFRAFLRPASALVANCHDALVHGGHSVVREVKPMFIVPQCPRMQWQLRLSPFRPHLSMVRLYLQEWLLTAVGCSLISSGATLRTSRTLWKPSNGSLELSPSLASTGGAETLSGLRCGTTSSSDNLPCTRPNHTKLTWGVPTAAPSHLFIHVNTAHQAAASWGSVRTGSAGGRGSPARPRRQRRAQKQSLLLWFA